MRRRTVAAALLACLLVDGCGVPADDMPRTVDRPRPDYRSGTPAPDGFGPVVERLYLVRDGKLVRVQRRLAVARSPQQMVSDLSAPPTHAEQQDGLATALSTMAIGPITLVQRRASIEIDTGPGQGARSDEVLAYGQIVCTLTSQGADVGTVSFTRGDTPLTVPQGDGSLTTEPLTIADYADLIEP